MRSLRSFMFFRVASLPPLLVISVLDRFLMLNNNFSHFILFCSILSHLFIPNYGRFMLRKPDPVVLSEFFLCNRIYFCLTNILEFLHYLYSIDLIYMDVPSYFPHISSYAFVFSTNSFIFPTYVFMFLHIFYILH